MVQPKTRRRIKLSPTSHWQVALIGAATGCALVGLGLSPTGSVPFDVIVLGLVGAFVTWSGCTAPWWMLVTASMVATAINPIGAGTVIGLAAIGLSVWVGVQQRSQPLLRAIGIALLMVSMAFVGNLFWLGVSTGVGVILAVGVSITGLQRRPSADRRAAWNLVGGTALLAVLVLAVAAFAGYRSRDNLRAANLHADRGLAAMGGADFEAASVEFTAAAEQFDQASGKLSAPWVQPIRLIPWAAQQWRAMDAVTGTAVDASLVVAESASTVDLDRLRINDGRIDLAAIRELEEPLREVREAVAALDSAIGTAESPWLLPQISSRLEHLRSDIDRQQKRGDKALEAVQLAPAILGAEGERRYFVMFTTPAEARGQGGFMGNYAEVTVNDGKISLTRQGRRSDLNAAMSPPTSLKHAPDDWMSIWGQYGFDRGAEHQVALDAWSIINMSAHFPNTAEVIAELYPQSGGNRLDGVFSLDVYGIEALVGLIGPVQVEGSPQLTGDNTAQYLLVDQYLGLVGDNVSENNAERIDMLSTIAVEVTTRLLTTSPPDPLELGRAMAPLAQENRVLAWSTIPEEQLLYEHVGLAGAVVKVAASNYSVDAEKNPSLELFVAINNSAGNKIDSFLETEVSTQEGTATIHFTNTAPRSGLPPYVIGSSTDGIPSGTNRAIVTIYASEPLDQLSLNGAELMVSTGREGGTYLYTFPLELASGASATLSMSRAEGLLSMLEMPFAVRPESVG